MSAPTDQAEATPLDLAEIREYLGHAIASAEKAPCPDSLLEEELERNRKLLAIVASADRVQAECRTRIEEHECDCAEAILAAIKGGAA